MSNIFVANGTRFRLASSLIAVPQADNHQLLPYGRDVRSDLALDRRCGDLETRQTLDEASRLALKVSFGDG